MLISAMALLVACGGGSSGSGTGPIYNGKTEQTKITADNADELTSAAIGGAGPAGGSANISNDAQTDQEKKTIAGFARGLHGATRSATRDFQGGSSSPTAAIVSTDETVEGECGGSAVIAGTRDDQVFNIDVTVTFNNFCNDGATFNGVISMKGYDDEVNFEVTMTFSNLTYQSKTELLAINGSMSSKGNDTNYSVSMTYDFRDNNAGKTYRVENLAFSIYEGFDYIEGSILGKVYHPDYGFFEITTSQVLRIYDVDGYPTSGSIKLSGAEGSYAEATYYANGRYKLTIFDGVETTIKDCDSKTDVCI